MADTRERETASARSHVNPFKYWRLAGQLASCSRPSTQNVLYSRAIRRCHYCHPSLCTARCIVRYRTSLPTELAMTMIEGTPRRDLRQIPDTQEVFLSPNSGVSIIFEVLERVALTDPSEAARCVYDYLVTPHGR